MGSSSQPEVNVKIGATTSSMSAGFSEAVSITEKGVARINGALAGLNNSYALNQRTASGLIVTQQSAVQSGVLLASTAEKITTTKKAVAAATEVSAMRYAQAAQKSIMLADAMARSGASGISLTSKILGVGSALGSVFGPGGLAVTAILGFAALAVRELSAVQDELEETKKVFTASVKEMVNAGDVEKMKKLAQDLWVGTPAEKFADGIVGVRRRIAELKVDLAGLNPVSGDAGKVRDEIAALEARLKMLTDQFTELRAAASDTVNVPQIFGGEPAVTVTAKRPGSGDADARRQMREAMGDREALWKAQYEREQALARNDYRLKLQLAQTHLNEIAETYGAQSAEYVNMLSTIEQMDVEERERRRQADEEFLAAELEHELTIAQVQREVREEYQRGWEEAIGRVTALIERSTAGIIDGTKSLGDAWRDFWRGFLTMALQNIAKVLQAWIAAEITKRVFGAATARQENMNAAVTAASKAWSAMAGIPVVGPALGAIAAAGAFAGVLAFGSSIKSAAGGWANVPNDQLAMVHKSEMILPAPLAESVRNMAEGGGGMGGGSITINAVDAASFEAMLRRNGSDVARVLMDMMRTGQLTMQPGR